MDAKNLKTSKPVLEVESGSTLETQSDEGSEPLAPDLPPLTADEYKVAHGEALSETLDLSTWRPGTDLGEMYARLEREVAEAVQKKGKYQQQIRERTFPPLRPREGAPPCAGVYRATIERLEKSHRQAPLKGDL